MASEPTLIGISRLPDEMLVAIFAEMLSPVDTFYQIGQVCRKWRYLSRSSPELWHKLKFYDRRCNLKRFDLSSYPIFVQSASLSTGVTSVNIQVTTYSDQKLFNAEHPIFPFANCLSFKTGYGFYWTDSAVQSLIACFPNLEVLEIFDISAPLLRLIGNSSIGSALKSLVLNLKKDIDTSEEMAVCFNHLPNLKKFALDPAIMRQNSVELFIKLIARLDYLYCCTNYATAVSILDSLTSQHDYSFASQFYDLSSSYEGMITIRLQFYPNTRQLEKFYLYLGGFSKLNFATEFCCAAIRCNAKSFERIRHLNIRMARSEIMSEIVTVCSNSLHSLELGYPKEMPWADLWSFCAKLPQLKVLKGIHCEHFDHKDDDEGTREQIARVASTLDCIECDSITIEDFISVLSTLPGEPVNCDELDFNARPMFNGPNLIRGLPKPSFLIKFIPGTRQLCDLHLNFNLSIVYADPAYKPYLNGMVDKFQSTLILSKAESFRSLRRFKFAFSDTATMSALKSVQTE